jgi:peptide chain release factor 2
MGASNFWDNPEKARQHIQSLKPLNALLKPYEELIALTGDLEALGELCAEDASLESELDGELRKGERKLNEFELQAMLSGELDGSNAFVRVQAGAGGTEACDWAQMLIRMFIRWAERHGYQTELVDEVRNPEAGVQSATLRVIGDYAYGNLQSEAGVHRLVRISPFDANKRRQTSFAGVDVTPEIDDDIEIEINPGDVITQTFTSGGPGGQHQNKTQSGVRLIHEPTGVRAECRNERSQHKNKDTCWRMLRARLYAIEEQKRLGSVERQYDEKGEIAWGNQIRNYVMEPYTLVKDRRTEVETSQVQKVLDGELDDFIQAYLRQKTEKEHKKTA